MMRIAALPLTLAAAYTIPAVAKDPHEGAWMIRMLACEGPDARMEVTCHNPLCSVRHRLHER
jgi:hypothetical protein